MISSIDNARAKKVWFDNENLWVLLFDGRQISVPLAFFPILLHASKEQRNAYEVSGGGIGIHWDELDEDISVAGLLLGIGDQTNRSKKIIQKS
ncbi:MAG: DUF2442 domain-containing protein [Leptospiraceae bacterium]|nr:DUF2442 domain-containing protein [Leptospiraceae bacterium]